MQPSLSSPFPPNLRRAEAARYLRETHGLPCAPATLAKYAWAGSGPPFRKAGTIPLYATADLDAWARLRLSEPMQYTGALSVRSRGKTTSAD